MTRCRPEIRTYHLSGDERILKLLTWRHISKPNGGHCHKTEIEGIKKGPVLKKKIIKNINHCQEVERVLISDADFFITYFKRFGKNCLNLHILIKNIIFI